MVKASRRWDSKPETPADTRFFNLRESGYMGWIDRDGYAVSCPFCHQPACTAKLTEPCNG
jgi:hypothetical protein